MKKIIEDRDGLIKQVEDGLCSHGRSFMSCPHKCQAPGNPFGGVKQAARTCPQCGDAMRGSFGTPIPTCPACGWSHW